MAGKIVVLCKGWSGRNDTLETYVKTLELAGYTCECLETLRFEFSNILELQRCLSAADKYSGLILTSPRAVEAIALAAKENANILYLWKNIPVYCVGPATASLARNSLDLQHCSDDQCGNSTKLAEKIICDINKDSKPLLYPCSEIARETIEEIFNDNGIRMQKIVVYRTLESEYLEENLLKILERSPSIFVFFSPSTVGYITALLKKHFFSTKDMKVVAIGPVTRDSLLTFGYDIYATASKPEPASLMHAITMAECIKKCK